MENEKKSKGLIIVITLLIIIILGLVGYICYDKGIILSKNETENKETKNDNKKVVEQVKQPVITTYSVDDEKITGLIEKLKTGLSCKGLDEYVMDKTVTINDISALRVHQIVEMDFDENKQTITLDEYSKQVQKYFGKDYKVRPEEIVKSSDGYLVYKYDEVNKVFNRMQGPWGYTCGPTTNYKIIKAVDTDGILKITINVVFGPITGSKYYSDYARTNEIGEFMVDSEDSLFDKGSSKYEFTFKLEDGNYVFVSSSPVSE